MRSISSRRPRPLGRLLPLVAVATLTASSASAAPTVRVGSQATVRETPARLAATLLEKRARAELASAASPTLVRTAIDRFGDGDAIVRFEQTHQGLPVIGRGATVRLASDPARVLTTIDLEASLPASTTPRVDATTAARALARFSRVGATADDAHLVVWPARGGARLAWVVLPRPTGLPTLPRVVVDAEDGSVLEARDLVVFAKAQMYRTNPLKSPSLELFDLPITPEGATLTSAELQAVNCVDKKTVKPVNFFGFAQNMRTCDLDQVATADVEGNFIAAPTDTPGSAESKSDAFSEVSIYFHAAKAYAYFRELQGVPDAIVTDDKPLRLVANLQLPPGVAQGNFASAGDPNKPLEPFSNAFFSPASGGLGDIFAQLYNYKGGALWFGQGPLRDYAYDGDVVYHEFGHAVVDHTLKLAAWTADSRGIIDAPGAMNEGLADYFSSAISGDPDVGEYASKDLAPNQTVIRTLANKDACPGALVGEPHFDSTLFSGALWEARTALANDGDRKKLDAGIYKAMRVNPGRGDLGYADTVRLFLATLQADFPAGAAALEAAMQGRGVLPQCERILSFEGKELRSPEARLGYASPGGASIGLNGMAPGIVQVKAKLPPSTGKVTLAFTVATGGGGGGGFGGGGTPYTPVVLVKFGKPITWTEGGKGLVHDADTFVKPKETTGAVTATFDVPASAAETEVFFQIANEGDDSGSYDALNVTSVPGEPPAPEATEEPAAPASHTETTTGCACTTAGDSRASAVPGALGFLAAACTMALRRRRRD